MGTLKAIFYAKDTVFISQHLLQPSIIASGVWLIRENIRVTVFFLRKTIVALLL